MIARIGALRHRERPSAPEPRQRLLAEHRLSISERTITNLLDRYDELLAVSLADDKRLKKIATEQGRVILALDGLQPDVGHEVPWVPRDCISGEVLLASACRTDVWRARRWESKRAPTKIHYTYVLHDLEACSLAADRLLARLIRTVAETLSVPIESVVSDGQAVDSQGGRHGPSRRHPPALPLPLPPGSRASD